MWWYDNMKYMFVEEKKISLMVDPAAQKMAFTL